MGFFNRRKNKTKAGAAFRYIRIILSLILAIICIYYLNSISIKNDLMRKSDFVSEKLTSISELAAAKYDYSNVIAIKNNLTFKDFNIPFTEKSFVIKYSGHITAGVDLTTAAFKINKNTLTITVPPCKILSHTIDEDNIMIFDEKTSIFNKLTMNDMLSEIILDKDKTEKELLDRGFLEEVSNDTKTLLFDIFSNCGFSEINIVISDI